MYIGGHKFEVKDTFDTEAYYYPPQYNNYPGLFRVR